MIFADTSFFIAQLQPRDALHQRALNWSQRDTAPLLTTEYALIEVADALSAPANRARFHTFLTFLYRANNCEIVPASSELFQSGLQLHTARLDKEWSLTDCISFAIMRGRNRTRALVYDHHFEHAGFEPLLRREPE